MWRFYNGRLLVLERSLAGVVEFFTLSVSIDIPSLCLTHKLFIFANE